MDMNIQLIKVIGKGNMDELCNFNPVHVKKYFGSCVGGEVSTVIEASLGAGGSSNGPAVGIQAGICTAGFGTVINGILLSTAAWYVNPPRRPVSSSSNSFLLQQEVASLLSSQARIP
jgi:hypothetical protein